MNKKILLLILLALLVVFTWYSTTTTKPSVETTQPGKQANTNPSVIIAPVGTAKFKITREEAIRNPPTINGTVKNIGNITGNVRVTGRVFYGGVVSDEKYVILEDIKPGQEANFTLKMSRTAQWIAYNISIAMIK